MTQPAQQQQYADEDDPLFQLTQEMKLHQPRLARLSQQPLDPNDPQAMLAYARQLWMEVANTVMPLMIDFAKQSTERHIRADDWMDDAAPLLPDIEKSGLTKQDAAEFLAYLEAVGRVLSNILAMSGLTDAQRDEFITLEGATRKMIDRVKDIQLPDYEEPGGEGGDDDEPDDDED